MFIKILFDLNKIVCNEKNICGLKKNCKFPPKKGKRKNIYGLKFINLNMNDFFNWVFVKLIFYFLLFQIEVKFSLQPKQTENWIRDRIFSILIF